MRAEIVAEISGNHLGDQELAHTLVETAKACGADAVKFQVYTPDEMAVLRGTGQAPPPWESLTLRELYAKYQTPHAWLPELFKHVRALGMLPSASVFGLESLAALQAVGCTQYKIAKADNANLPLIEAVVATKMPTYISVGQNRWHSAGMRYAHWLWCPGGYPAKPEEMCLRALRHVWCAGLSCHCKAPLIAPMAVAAGAKMLEYHLMLTGTEAPDAAFALDELDFATMASNVREAEALRG